MQPGAIANALSWLLIIALAVGVTVVAARLGFVALLILGLGTWLICTRIAMDEDAPTWGTAVFKARMAPPASPEAHAAAKAQHHALAGTLRFYRWCGIALAVVGAAGFAWQQWR